MSQPEPPEPWNDGLYDGIALVEAFRRDDETTSRAVAAILRANGMQMANVALELAKLLSEVCQEQRIDPVHMRRWAEQASRRP